MNEKNKEKIKIKINKEHSWIYHKLRHNPEFLWDILDNFHRFTRDIEPYRFMKLLISLSVISSDSWDFTYPKRNTINQIILGDHGTLKTSIYNSFSEILNGDLNVIGYEAAGYEAAGYEAEEKRIFYDLFARFYKKTIIIDDMQEIEDRSNLSFLKCLEDGNINISKDGNIINKEIGLSVILSISSENMPNRNQSISFLQDFFKKSKNILEIFDIYYFLPPLNNKTNQIIADRLEETPKNTLNNKELLYYLTEAKKCYKSIKIDDSIHKEIMEIAEKDKIERIRYLLTIIKIIKGIAALRLKAKVDKDDLLLYERIKDYIFTPKDLILK